MDKPLQDAVDYMKSRCDLFREEPQFKPSYEEFTWDNVLEHSDCWKPACSMYHISPSILLEELRKIFEFRKMTWNSS